MHELCSKLLLDRHEIPTSERPVPTEGEDVPIVFCTKTCYMKWVSLKKKAAKAAVAAEKAVLAAAKKKRVPWEEDGSMDVLMEWLTTQGNYSNYCGGNGNRGKSKAQYYKDLSIMIKNKLPETSRTEKDVENKIVALERQFREASDWANNTGQGVSDPGDFEAAILQRCPYYHQLEDIMKERT